jgi:hypothetical protein
VQAAGAARIGRLLSRCGLALVLLGIVGGVWWWWNVSGSVSVKLLVGVGHILGAGAGVVVWSHRDRDATVARRWLAIAGGALVFPAAFGAWFYVQVTAETGGFDAVYVLENPGLHVALLGPAISLAAAGVTRLLVTHHMRVDLTESGG